MSVTEIETWRRDPYAIYARRILKLEPLDAEPGAADRGSLIHRALDEFVKTYPAALPADAVERLLAIGRRWFGPMLSRPAVWAFWWPRFEAIARWFVAHETERRRTIVPVASEATGALAVPFPSGEFALRARVDRIDRLPDGSLAIIDYKTGGVPGPGEVFDGFAPQLPLEAALARFGKFRDVPAAPVTQLRYWKLSGGDPAGKEVALDGAKLAHGKPMPDPPTLADQALAGLRLLIARFDDPATPYHARPLPEYALRYNDYAHLARIKEWSTAEEDE